MDKWIRYYWKPKKLQKEKMEKNDIEKENSKILKEYSQPKWINSL